MVNAMELLRGWQDSQSERENRRTLAELAQRKFAAEEAMQPGRMEEQRLSNLAKMTQLQNYGPELERKRQAEIRAEQLARDTLAARERMAGQSRRGGVPIAVMGPDGKPVYVNPSEAVGRQPASVAGKSPMSAAAQKELIETDEQLQGASAALSLFGQARAVNDKAMGFTGAGALATLGTAVPDIIGKPTGIKETVEATKELDNILQSAALPQLKAIFGGMPTEGERKILLDVQGSSSQPPDVRKRIFDRAEAAVRARMKFSADKAKALREGTYFTGDGGVNPMATFSPSPSLSGQDAAAMEWANANPSDPRAAEIKRRLGGGR